MEVVLAIMVVALGVMSAFAMIPNALRMGADAQGNVKTAMVGSTILNTLRSHCYTSGFNWDSIGAGEFSNLPFNPPGFTAAPSGFGNGNTTEVTTLTVSAQDFSTVALVRSMKLLMDGNTGGAANKRPAYSFSYQASFHAVGDVVKLKVVMWGNEFKTGDGTTFYTEVYRSEAPSA